MSELKVVNHYSTLSAAIRAGAKLLPQGYTGLASISEVTGMWTTCALGAAYHALTGTMPGNNENEYGFLKEVFPYHTVQSRLQCPDCGDEQPEPRMVVWHLNDYHRWSREKIADWLEEWENTNLGYETLTTEEEVSEQQVQYAQCGD